MKELTVIEALKVIANRLGMIAVPRSLNRLIGIPIDNAIADIDACIEALSEEPPKNDQNGSEDEEIVIEPVTEGEQKDDGRDPDAVPEA